MIMALALSVNLIANPTFFLKIEEISSSDSECILEISIAGSEAMFLGSSNLQVLFDESHLANPTLISTDLGQNYGVSVTQPTTTKASMNIELFIPEAGHSVTAFPEWTVIGQVKFDILNPAGSESISWSYNGSTTETVVFIDDEATQIFVGNSDTDLIGVVHGTTVSIDGIPGDSGIMIYPNPFEDHIRLESKTTLESYNSVSLLDARGQILRIWNIPAGTSSFEIEKLGGLPPGVYFLQVDESGESQTLKVVKL